MITIKRTGSADSWRLTASAEGERPWGYRVSRRYPLTRIWTVSTRGTYLATVDTLAEASSVIRADYAERVMRKA